VEERRRRGGGKEKKRRRKGGGIMEKVLPYHPKTLQQLIAMKAFLK
jgi:hypothetical protein